MVLSAGRAIGGCCLKCEMKSEEHLLLDSGQPGAPWLEQLSRTPIVGSGKAVLQKDDSVAISFLSEARVVVFEN